MLITLFLAAFTVNSAIKRFVFSGRFSLTRILSEAREIVHALI